MANETLKPAIQNRDALVQKGFISPELAASLAPAPTSKVETPAILEETTPVNVNEEFTPNSAGNIAPIQRVKDLKTAEESAPDMSNFISIKEPIVEVAQDVVLEDAKQQQIQQLAESNARIAEQQKLEEMNLEKQVAAENAVKSVAAKETLKQKTETDQIQAEINKEQAELEKFSINDIVKNRSTGDSILASLAVILGGIGAGMTGSGTNQGLQAVNSKLDREFENQKLSLSDKLAKKRRVFDLMNLQLKQKAQQTDDAMAKQRMSLMSAQIEVEKAKLIQDQVKAKLDQNLIKRLTSSEGLTREEAFQLSPEQQKKAVPFGDGKVRIALTASGAKKLNEEIIPTARDAARGIKRLKEISNQFAGGSLDLNTRGEADLIKQSLIGALRLNLFGPGTISDSERSVAEKIIGNPATLTSLSAIEKTKLDALNNKLIQGTKDYIRSSGIDLPKSINDLKIEQLQKNNKGLSRQAAIKALSEAGKFDEESTDF